MNSNHPLRALIRSIITEAPLDDYYSVAPPTGPRTQGHVPPEQIPALRKLFDRLGHTYSIQVATNPLRSWEALKPLIKNKTLKKLNSKKSGVWIIPSSLLSDPAVRRHLSEEYPTLGNLLKSYKPDNIHILSHRPSQASDLYGPRWLLHDLLGHPLEETLASSKRALEKEGSPLNTFVTRWISRNSPEGLMVYTDLLPELVSLLLTLPIPPTAPPPVLATLEGLKDSLNAVLDSWKGSIVVVGPI
jgi:hypothetical protein